MAQTPYQYPSIVRSVRAKWWKYLGALLLLYAVSLGLIVPLGPGVVSVYPFDLDPADPAGLTVELYNADAAAMESEGRAFLRSPEGNFICAERILRVAKGLYLVEFPPFPQIGSDSKKLDLVVNNPVDGTFALRQAVQSRSDEAAAGEGSFCQPEVSSDDAGFFSYPYREILYESIRNLFFHVPIWFGMVLLLLFSFGSSIAYLNSGNLFYDRMSSILVDVGLLYGLLGLTTGMMWANFTWGSPWPNDPRLNGAAIAELAYLAYLVLRSSVGDDIRRARISAVYNIFAFVIYIVFIFVIPRFSDSLHPGVGGNPAFSQYDLDNTMRMVFYPSVMGFTFIGFWMASIRLRLRLAADRKNDLL